MGTVTTVIVVILVLVALGIISDQLFRLRDWLKRTQPPPGKGPDGDGGPEHRSPED